jgi:hypothetical protein
MTVSCMLLRKLNVINLIPSPTSIFAVVRFVSDVILKGAKHSFSLCQKRHFTPV